MNVRLSPLACARVVLSLWILTGMSTSAAEELPLRTWRTSSGATLKARYEKREGPYVVLTTDAGKPVRVGLSKLSMDDQELVRTLDEEQKQARREAFRTRSRTVGKPARGPDAGDVTFASAEEQAVLAETNLARTDPAGYAKHLRAFRATHEGGGIFNMPGVGRVATREGLAAVDEAIAFLEKAKALKPLSLSKGLTAAARDHALDIGPVGKVGHDGTDGSTTRERVERRAQWLSLVGENIAFGPRQARQIVVQLIIDDGVPDRGHRKNIYNPGYGAMGAAIENHTRYGTVCVIDYAGGVKER